MFCRKYIFVIAFLLLIIYPFSGLSTDDGGIKIKSSGISFYQGIELESGRYQVEDSADGYEAKRLWVMLAAGEDKTLDIRLKPAAVLGMEFVYIKPGTFMMGSAISPEEVEEIYGGKVEWYKDEHPRHQVALPQGFYMQTTEVTVRQWRAFVQDTSYQTEAESGGGAYIFNGKKWEKKEGYYWDNPGFSQLDNHPVTCVSWNDLQAFISWLNRKEGKNYRLPTEAEWEYAARAGSTTRFCFGNDIDILEDYAWYRKNSGRRTHPVAQKKPNVWGLYDMHGNVWEWVQDWHGNYPSGSITDPKGPSNGSKRVLRGGSWNGAPKNVRAAFRHEYSPDNRVSYLGFRLVSTVER